MLDLKKGFKAVLAISAFSALMLIPFEKTNAASDAETQQFLKLINDYRAQYQRAPLSLDASLQASSDWMSEDMLAYCMASGQTCTHTDSTGRKFNDRITSFGYPVTQPTGENIAWGGGSIGNAKDVFVAWRNSMGHNANMVSASYNAIGISRSCKGSACAWVTDFGGKVATPFNSGSVPSSTPAPSPNPLPVQSPSRVPVSSPAPAPSVSSSNAPKLQDGALIRKNGGIDVYIVKYAGAKKYKRLILNPSVFRNYGHLKWENVQNIDQKIVDSFPTSGLVRAAGDSKVYKLNPAGDRGEKRWISSPGAFLKLGFDSDAIYQINSYDRDSYRTGAALR